MKPCLLRLPMLCMLQVAELGVSYVLMHMRGTPQTMQTAQNTQYTPGKLAVEVGQELQTQADAAVSSGIEPWRIILDPGEMAHSRDHRNIASMTL